MDILTETLDVGVGVDLWITVLSICVGRDYRCGGGAGVNLYACILILTQVGLLAETTGGGQG